MRILLINYEYPPVGAGAATATKAMGRALSASGHNVTVLTTRYGRFLSEVEEGGVNVIRVDSRRRRAESASILEMVSFMMHALWVVRRLVRTEKIEGVIEFFSIPCGPVALWAHWATKVPYIVSLRGGDVPGAEPGLGVVHRLLTPIRRAVMRSARAVVANSSGLKLLAEKADPFPVSVIANGVDSSFFVPLPSPKCHDDVKLLFVGRFQKQKNLLWLLEQFESIAKGSHVRVSLDMVGDGPQKSEVIEQIATLGLSESVFLHGWLGRSQLRDYYQNANLVLNPSLYEGMPNVVLEAMSCGCAVLASRVPGNDAVVQDGVTGWLFDLNDSEGFQKRISDVISNPQLARDAGSAGRLRVEHEFSWSHAAQSYLELLGDSTPISSHQ